MSARHLSCLACRIRVPTSAPEVVLLDGRCPICGVMLTPVSSALDVLGFRAFSLDQLSEHRRDSPGTLADFAARLEAASPPEE